MSEELERRIANAYGDQVVRAKPEVLQRILERRARGERVTLLEHRRPVLWPYGLIAAGLAAMLLLIPNGPGIDSVRVPQERRISRLAERMLMPGQLVAQGAAHPSFPTATAHNDIKPGEWAYAWLGRDTPFNDTMAVHHLRLVESTYGGRPIWLLLTREGPRNSPADWKDSTYMSRNDVRVVARSFGVSGSGRVTEEYREHEMLRGYTAGGATSWSVIALDSSDQSQANGFSFQIDALTLILQQAPLTADWTGSIPLHSLPMASRMVLRWFDLAVVGDERVRVPAGEFDCWKVRMGPPGRDLDSGFFFWVSKDKHWLIQQGIQGGPQESHWRSVLISGRQE